MILLTVEHATPGRSPPPAGVPGGGCGKPRRSRRPAPATLRDHHGCAQARRASRAVGGALRRGARSRALRAARRPHRPRSRGHGRPRGAGTSTRPRAAAAWPRCCSSLLAYARGAGVDARWAVIAGDARVLRVTKRIHNRLHGSPGDGGAARRGRARGLRAHAGPERAELAGLVRAGRRRDPPRPADRRPRAAAVEAPGRT